MGPQLFVYESWSATLMRGVHVVLWILTNVLVGFLYGVLTMDFVIYVRLGLVGFQILARG